MGGGGGGGQLGAVRGKDSSALFKPQLQNTDNSFHYVSVPKAFVHDCKSV